MRRILLSDTLSLTVTSGEICVSQMLATGRCSWKEEMAPDPEGTVVHSAISQGTEAGVAFTAQESVWRVPLVRDLTVSARSC